MTKTYMAKELISNDLKIRGYNVRDYADWVVTFAFVDWALDYTCHKYTKAELEEKIRFMNAWYESQKNRAVKVDIDMEMIPEHYYNEWKILKRLMKDKVNGGDR